MENIVTRSLKRMGASVLITLLALSSIAQATSVLPEYDLRFVPNTISTNFWQDSTGTKFATVGVDIENAGNISLGDIEAHFIMRYRRDVTVTELTPNNALHITATWELDDDQWAGNNPITFSLDPNNKINNETSEDNNILNANIDIPRNHMIGNGERDLYVKDIMVYEPGNSMDCVHGPEDCNLKPGDTMVIEADITNSGSDDANAPFDVSFNVDNLSTVVIKNQKSVAAGSTISVMAELTMPKISNPSGEYKDVQVYVDANDHVAETNEDNNLLLRQVYAHPLQTAAPVQLYPRNGDVYRNFPREVTFAWQEIYPVAEDRVTYYVEVDCLSCTESGRWSSNVLYPNKWKEVSTSGTDYTMTLPGDNTYSWRVYAKFDTGEETPVSKWVDFSFNTSNPAPAPTFYPEPTYLPIPPQPSNNRNLYVQEIITYKVHPNGMFEQCTYGDCILQPGDDILVETLIYNNGDAFNGPMDVSFTYGTPGNTTPYYYDPIKYTVYDMQAYSTAYASAYFSVPKLDNFDAEWHDVHIKLNVDQKVTEYDYDDNKIQTSVIVHRTITPTESDCKEYYQMFKNGTLFDNYGFYQETCRAKYPQTWSNESSNKVTDAPTITSPIDGNTYYNYPRTTNVQWTGVNNANYYMVEVDCFHCVKAGYWSSEVQGEPWITYSVSGGEFNFDFVGDQEGRVRVWGVDENGNAGPKSKWHYFSYDTSGYNSNNNNPSTIPSAERCYELKRWYDAGQLTSKLNGNIQEAVDCARYYPWIWNSSSSANNSNNSGSQVATPPAGFEEEIRGPGQSFRNPFTDVNASTLEGEAAIYLYHNAVIGGYPDGEFKGYREVNRAEITKFMLLAKGSRLVEPNNSPFYDVQVNDWFAKYVLTALEKDFIQGYADGSFKPAQTVNTAEFLKMLHTVFNLETGQSYSFTDVNNDAWYAQYAGTAAKYNLFPLRGNTLKPGEPLTRAEVAIALYKFLSQR